MEEWAVSNPWPFAGIAVAVIVIIFGIGKWVGAINSDRASFKTFMNEVRDDIKRILARLPTPTVEPGSPLQLTEFGEKISRSLGVKDWALNEAMGLLAEVEEKEPYEVHDFCVDHVQMQFDLGDALYVRIRAGAYENGTTVKSVQDVFVIELRDALLRLMEMSS